MKRNALFIIVFILALGCKAVFVFAPAKQKTVDIKINAKSATSAKKDTASTKKNTSRNQINISQ